jgi:gliding motility-associated-like protein
MVVDTFHIYSLPIAVTSAIKDTNVCFLNNTPILSAPPAYNTYLWSDGMTTQQDTMSQPGTKWVQAQTGCTMVVDTFHVHDWRDTAKMTMDTSHCVAYSPIPVTAPGGYSSYTWSDGHIGQADTFFSTSTKWVTALNGCNMLIDTVHFTATTIPQDSVSMYGGDTTLCFDNVASVNVSGPPGYTFYLWNDGITTQTNNFSGPGTKWVYAQKLCYLLIDTFSVSAQPTDTTTRSTDTMICFSNAVTLSATSGYDTYLWSDGTTTQANTFTQTGIKEVYAHKACAERIDTFNVTFINDLSVDLGPDTSICKGESVTLDATSSNYPDARYEWQDGKTAATYQVSEGGDYSVTVSVGPCTVSDTIRVHQKVIDIDLGKGLLPCHEESITLDAGVDNANYLWQDGSTERTYKATKAGTYSVKVTQDNCSATASVEVKYEGCPCNVIIPTAFSPNNDNKNDKFGVTLSCDIQSFRLMIYNRWGNQVFYSEDVNDKWDGTSKGIALDGDVFDYYAEFKDGEGKVYYYKGTVTLVR